TKSRFPVLCLSSRFEWQWQFPTNNGHFHELCLRPGLYALSFMLFLFSPSSLTPFSSGFHINLQPLYWFFILFHPHGPHPPNPHYYSQHHLLCSSPSSLIPTSIQVCSYSLSTRVFAS
ncbi:unnamed protein product, partial [Prunus brigantina]